MAKQRLGMVIDTGRCMACNSCAVACKVENNLPQGIWWNRVHNDGGPNLDSPKGKYPNLGKMMTITLACQHCENPACVKVCPVGATYKDSETGVVRQDYQKCIGCRMCMAACPYTGALSFLHWDEDPPGSSILAKKILAYFTKCARVCKCFSPKFSRFSSNPSRERARRAAMRANSFSRGGGEEPCCPRGSDKSSSFSSGSRPAAC